MLDRCPHREKNTATLWTFTANASRLVRRWAPTRLYTRRHAISASSFANWGQVLGLRRQTCPLLENERSYGLTVGRLPSRPPAIVLPFLLSRLSPSLLTQPHALLGVESSRATTKSTSAVADRDNNGLNTGGDPSSPSQLHRACMRTARLLQTSSTRKVKELKRAVDASCKSEARCPAHNKMRVFAWEHSACCEAGMNTERRFVSELRCTPRLYRDLTEC